MSDIVETVVAAIREQAPPHYRITVGLWPGEDSKSIVRIRTGTDYTFELYFTDGEISVVSSHTIISEPYATNSFKLADPEVINKICGIVVRHFAHYKIPESSDWYNTTKVDNECTPFTHCVDCEPDGACYICDTIEGRYFPVVTEYASTCDGCHRPYLNSSQRLHPDDENSSMPRAYCPHCYYKLFRKLSIHSEL